MEKYVLIADANCDLNKELRDRFGVATYIPSHIIIDGEDHLSDTEWELYKTPAEFYKDRKSKKKTFSTAASGVGHVASVFEEYLSKGLDLIYFCMSGTLSGTYKIGLMAKNELQEKYPDRKIEVIDSLRFSTGLAILIAEAGKRRLEGFTYEELLAWIEENKNKIHQMGPMDDLIYLARARRINNFAGFMGQLVGVKPLGDFNKNGMTTVLGKAKGREAALKATVEYIKRTIVNPSEQTIWMTDTDRPEMAKTLKAMIEKEIAPKEIIYVPCGPACGVNIGPGLCAAYYFGEEISDNNEKEKAVMAEVLGK